jgi:acetyl-CoA acetyltransferase
MPTESSQYRRKAAIVGVGCTEFSKNSGRSELHNAVLAVKTAADDAGLKLKDIDGLIFHNMDRVNEVQMVDTLGLDNVRFTFESVQGAGGNCGAIGLAGLAVLAGKANYVAVYRSLNGRSQDRYGSARGSRYADGPAAWRAPFGLVMASHQIAMRVRRYMIETGAQSRHFGAVSVAFRKHASVNPDAYFYGKPITLEDHQASPVFVDPLRRLDITPEYDAAGAVIVTSAERAADLRQRPAYIAGWAQATGRRQDPMIAAYRQNITDIDEARLATEEAFAMAGITHEDVQVLQIYDHFAPMVVLALESMGFCGRGEGYEFVQNGGIEIGGRLPVNTHGGNLGEGYIHFMNHIREGVRQIRGTSPNQVPSCEVSFLMPGYGVTTSALVLTN